MKRPCRTVARGKPREGKEEGEAPRRGPAVWSVAKRERRTGEALESNREGKGEQSPAAALPRGELARPGGSGKRRGSGATAAAEAELGRRAEREETSRRRERNEWGARVRTNDRDATGNDAVGRTSMQLGERCEAVHGRRVRAKKRGEGEGAGVGEGRGRGDLASDPVEERERRERWSSRDKKGDRRTRARGAEKTGRRGRARGGGKGGERLRWARPLRAGGKTRGGEGKARGCCGDAERTGSEGGGGRTAGRGEEGKKERRPTARSRKKST